MKRYRDNVPARVQMLMSQQVMHIALDLLDNALEWETRVRAAVLSLRDNPGYARDEQASERLGKKVWRLVFERTYLIHFTVDKTNAIVNVIGFRHGARMPGPGEP